MFLKFFSEDCIRKYMSPSNFSSCLGWAFLVFPNGARPFVVLLMVFESDTVVGETLIGIQVNVMLSFLPEQSGVSSSKVHCCFWVSHIY